LEVSDEAIEPVRDRRATRATCLVIRYEHEVVDEKLRASPEEISQRGAPLLGLELVRLVDPHPWQLLSAPRQLVAAPREILLCPEQLQPCGEPFFTCPGDMRRHRPSLLRRFRSRHDM